MTEEVTITGLRELREALTKTIPFEMQGKVLQKALSAGTAITVRQARMNAPVRTGVLRRAIYALRDKRDSKPTFESRLVAVRSGKRHQKNDRDAFYWKFVEFGHRTTGKEPREIPPKPFLRPAFETTKMQSAVAIRDRLAELLNDAARKARW